jgi:rhodanese-related sulfurtransferase
MALRKAQGKELYNLADGYRRWIEAGLPVEAGNDESKGIGSSQLP